MRKKQNLLVYDIEIVKAIQRKGEERYADIDYCDGFWDHKNCGISVICAHDWVTGRFRVFTEENFEDFERLASQRVVAGFNSIAFDDQVLDANNLQVKTEYDLLVECWIADGLGPEYVHPSHGGYGLNYLSIVNGFGGKTGDGAMAPVDWQMKRYGSVIDYCIEDCRQTSLLIRKVIDSGMFSRLISPKTKRRFKKRIRKP